MKALGLKTKIFSPQDKDCIRRWSRSGRRNQHNSIS